jgi:hypothetical protein
VLTITRRDPAHLPVSMTDAYAAFVTANWPFQARRGNR